VVETVVPAADVVVPVAEVVVPVQEPVVLTAEATPAPVNEEVATPA